MKQRKNQHEWGVIAQCKNPYREFQYCPLCKTYKETETDIRFSSQAFKVYANILAKNGNPMFEPDSNRLLGDN